MIINSAKIFFIFIITTIFLWLQKHQGFYKGLFCDLHLFYTRNCDLQDKNTVYSLRWNPPKKSRFFQNFKNDWFWRKNVCRFRILLLKSTPGILNTSNLGIFRPQSGYYPLATRLATSFSFHLGQFWSKGRLIFTRACFLFHLGSNILQITQLLKTKKWK